MREDPAPRGTAHDHPPAVRALLSAIYGAPPDPPGGKSLSLTPELCVRAGVWLEERRARDHLARLAQQGLLVLVTPGVFRRSNHPHARDAALGARLTGDVS